MRRGSIQSVRYVQSSSHIRPSTQASLDDFLDDRRLLCLNPAKAGSEIRDWRTEGEEPRCEMDSAGIGLPDFIRRHQYHARTGAAS